MSARARDIARFGQLVLEDGYGRNLRSCGNRGYARPARSIRTSEAPSRRRIRSRSSPAAGIATSSGSFRDRWETSSCAWASTARWCCRPGDPDGLGEDVLMADRLKIPAALIDTIRAFVAAGRHLAGFTAGRCSERARTGRPRRGPRARTQLTTRCSGAGAPLRLPWIRSRLT